MFSVCLSTGGAGAGAPPPPEKDFDSQIVLGGLHWQTLEAGGAGGTALAVT